MIVDTSPGYILEQFRGNGENRTFTLAEMTTYENEVNVSVDGVDCERSPGSSPLMDGHNLFTLQYRRRESGEISDRMTIRMLLPPPAGSTVEILYKTSATNIIWGQSAMRGSSHLEAGYIYAPYIPIYTSPIIRESDIRNRIELGEVPQHIELPDHLTEEQAREVIQRFRDHHQAIAAYQDLLRTGPGERIAYPDFGTPLREVFMQEEIETTRRRLSEAVAIPPEYLNPQPRPMSFNDIRQDLERYIRRWTALTDIDTAAAMSDIVRLLAVHAVVPQDFQLETFDLVENPIDPNTVLREVEDVPRPTIEEIRELGAPEFHFTAPELMDVVHIHNIDGLVLNTIKISVNGEFMEDSAIHVDMQRAPGSARVILQTPIEKGQEVSVFCKRDQLRHNAEIDLTPKRHIRKLNIPGVNDE